MTTTSLPKPTRIQVDARYVESSWVSANINVDVAETEQILLAERNELLKELAGLWADRFSPEKPSDAVVREWRYQWKRF